MNDAVHEHREKGKSMKIGICYDTKENYGLDSMNMDYTDFSTYATVSDISYALSQAGHVVGFINGLEQVKKLTEGQVEYDLVFNISEGFGSRNREGLVPSLLELYKIPFSGSDAYALSLTLNKLHTKLIAQYLGIPTPKFVLFSDHHDIAISELLFPLVVKPNAEGGSMGVFKVNNDSELRQRCQELFSKYGCEILCEEYIDGIEITAPVIGNGNSSRCIGVTAVQHSSGEDIEIYDSNLKYFGDIILTTDFNCPEKIKRTIMNYSEKLHKFLSLRDYSRSDFRLSKENIPYLLEVNPLPALDRDDTFEVCGNALNLHYHETLNMIVIAAAKRYGIINE